MKSIGIIVNGIQVEGITTVTLNYLKNIDRTNYEIHLIIGGGPVLEKLLDELRNDISIHYLPSRQHSTLLYFTELYKLCKEYKLDVIHVNGNSSTIAIDLFAAYLAGVKKRIAHSHNTTCDHRFLNFLLKPLLVATCNCRVACGDDAGKWMFKKDFFVLKNGIDLERYQFDERKRNLLRKKLGIESNQILIGHVGCFNDQKNQIFIVKLAQLGKKENRKYILIGDGPNKNKIESYAKQCNVSNIIFGGCIDNVDEMLSAMDIFILPSLYEGLPNILVEAQAAGLTCYVSNGVTLESNLTGLITFLSLDNFSAWENLLCNGNNDRVKDSRKAVNSLKELGYDIKIAAKQLENIYEGRFENGK